MRLGSLCTGIGGLDLAVEAHFGAATIWCAEWEQHLDPIIQRHFGPVLNLRDLTTVAWDELEPVDVLTAGYPCQPFSHAGKRKGSSDVRHLWPHIAEAVRVLRPQWVVLENVAGHLTLGFGDVLRDLAEAGFDAEWCLLRASDVGACHQRARVFIVARDADSSGLEGRPAVRSGGGERAPRPSGLVAATDADDSGRHGWEASHEPPMGGRHGLSTERCQGERELARVAGPPTDADRRAGSQPHVGAQQPGLEAPRRSDPGRLDQAATDPRCVGWGPGTGLRTDEPGGEQRGRPCHDDGPTDWGPYAPAIRRHALVLGRHAPRPTDDAGRLSPAFVEWMMMYPAGWVDGLTRTQALKALGNAVVPQQAIAALRELVPLEQEAAA